METTRLTVQDMALIAQNKEKIAAFTLKNLHKDLLSNLRIDYHMESGILRDECIKLLSHPDWKSSPDFS